jgi:hypothetical protein
MRRRRLLVVLAGLAVAVAAGTVVLWPSRPNVAFRMNQENLRRAQKLSMTRSEVYGLFGPPADYSTGPVTMASVLGFGPPRYPVWYSSALSVATQDEAIWLTDTGIGSVFFDSDDRVCVVTYSACDRDSEGALGNLLWRAQREWHRWFPE